MGGGMKVHNDGGGFADAADIIPSGREAEHRDNLPGCTRICHRFSEKSWHSWVLSWVEVWDVGSIISTPTLWRLSVITPVLWGPALSSWRVGLGPRL